MPFLPSSDITITDTYVVASQAQMLALSATRGDVAVRTDTGQTFILQTEPPSVLGNWILLPLPGDLVTSVNGQSGPTVTLDAGDVGADPEGTAAEAVSIHAGTAASEIVSAHAEIATQAEVNAGADDARIVTPMKLATRIAALRYQIPILLGRNEIAPFPATFILVGGKYWELPNTLTRQVRGSSFVPAEIDLTASPTLNFKYIVSAVGAGNANVRFQVTAKYTATNASASGAADETFVVSSPVTNVLNQEHEVNLTLDKTKIDAFGVMHFVVSRLGADSADTFTGDVAIDESAQVMRA